MFGTVHSASTVRLYIRVYPYIVCIVYAFVNYARTGKHRVYPYIVCTHSLRSVQTVYPYARAIVHNLIIGDQLVSKLS